MLEFHSTNHCYVKGLFVSEWGWVWSGCRRPLPWEKILNFSVLKGVFWCYLVSYKGENWEYTGTAKAQAPRLLSVGYYPTRNTECLWAKETISSSSNKQSVLVAVNVILVVMLLFITIDNVCDNKFGKKHYLWKFSARSHCRKFCNFWVKMMASGAF